jgi:hypothetical protein
MLGEMPAIPRAVTSGSPPRMFRSRLQTAGVSLFTLADVTAQPQTKALTVFPARHNSQLIADNITSSGEASVSPLLLRRTLGFCGWGLRRYQGPLLVSFAASGFLFMNFVEASEERFRSR